MDMDTNIHFLLGELEAADEWIEYLSRKKGQLIRQKLTEAKKLRSEVIAKINALADCSIIIPLKRD